MAVALKFVKFEQDMAIDLTCSASDLKSDAFNAAIEVLASAGHSVVGKPRHRVVSKRLVVTLPNGEKQIQVLEGGRT